MNRQNFALLLLTATLCGAQVKVATIGIARLADGTVRTLYGLPDDVIIDARSFGSFDAASFSDRAGLVASHGRIQLVTTDFTCVGEYESGEAHPLLNVESNAESAIAWLPENHALLHWDGKAFLSTSVHGLDSSLRANAVRARSGGIAQLLLNDGNGSVFEATISLTSGELLSLKPLAGIHGAAFWKGSTILFQDANGMEAAGSNGTLQTIAVSARDVTFAHISSDWVLITAPSSGRSWALYKSGDEFHLSEVPK